MTETERHYREKERDKKLTEQRQMRLQVDKAVFDTLSEVADPHYSAKVG